MSYLDDALDMISFDPLKIEDKARAELAALRAENKRLRSKLALIALWPCNSGDGVAEMKEIARTALKRVEEEMK